MKRNKLLILSLLACTLLVGCNEGSHIKDGSNFVGQVGNGDQTIDTELNLQKFYETLKTSSGGSVAVQTLLEKLASYEYSDEFLAATHDTFNVKNYHTTDTLKKDIEKVFQDIVDGTTYLDEDGNFDPDAFRDYVTETLDYEVSTETKTSSNYIGDSELRDKLVYNYDEYIEDSIKPSALIDYIYQDYVTSSTKYKSQFTNQYAVRLEVLKLDYDTTKLNGSWNEKLIKDVKAITKNQVSGFGTDYSFVTFNSDNQMIVFTTTSDKLSYEVYDLDEANVEKYVPAYETLDGDKTQFDQWDITDLNSADAQTVNSLKIADKKVASKSWEITTSSTSNGEFYKHIEDVLIARKLWKIDYEVILAKNYDFKTAKYNAMTETEKTEAQGFSSTYSSSNTKPIKEVTKQNKITAQQAKYYSEPDYYTRSTYTNVLPTALSSLRGTSAKDLMSHLVTFKEGAADSGAIYNENDLEVATSRVDNYFLLPNGDSATDPVYLDTSSNTYYICEVSSWYGLYRTNDPLKSNAATKTVSNYQIESYQAGKMETWKLDNNSYVKAGDDILYSNNPDSRAKFEDVIELVQLSADNILTDAMRKEAVVALFEKYQLEINDQDIYDYVLDQYPDYFGED